MASAIENFLFSHDGTHALVSITLSPDQVAIAVAPWTDLSNVTEAVFQHAKLLSFEQRDTSSEELALPWDIIAFDCTQQCEGQWEFVLYCNCVEFVFLADFPTIVVAQNSQLSKFLTSGLVKGDPRLL